MDHLQLPSPTARPNGHGHTEPKPSKRPGKVRSLEPDKTVGGLCSTRSGPRRGQCNAVTQSRRHEARPHLQKAREYEMEARMLRAALRIARGFARGTY